MSKIFEQVYEIVKQIPKGNVATYGQIAELLGDKYLSRTVGNALCANTNPTEIPCHRVVNYKGDLAEKYAFGGMEKQKEKLLLEGIVISGNRVDLSKYQWNGILEEL